MDYGEGVEGLLIQPLCVRATPGHEASRAPRVCASRRRAFIASQGRAGGAGHGDGNGPGWGGVGWGCS